MSQSLKKHGQQVLVLILCELLVLLPALGAPARTEGRAADSSSRTASGPVEPLPLQSYLLKSYLNLFKISPELHFNYSSSGSQWSPESDKLGAPHHDNDTATAE